MNTYYLVINPNNLCFLIGYTTPKNALVVKVEEHRAKGLAVYELSKKLALKLSRLETDDVLKYISNTYPELAL